MSSNKDILPPKIIKDKGAIHPINHMKDSIMNLLVSLGFEIIDGPGIETEEFNFDMLNIKKTHPARQMHDTFYVDNKSNLLRTHTSPVQIRGMLEKSPPFAFISGGKVYRKDDDATHLPMFHQIEGILVDENVKFRNIQESIKKVNQCLIKKVALFDVYRGENLPAGKKSYGIGFKISDKTKTLSIEEIDSLLNKIIVNLEKNFGAKLR